jgi:hypothetical protein
MRPGTELAYYSVWVLQPILQTITAAVLAWRKLSRRFPVFFAYTIFQVAAFAVLFPARLIGGKFFVYTDWWLTTASLVFGLFVIYEVFLESFRYFHTLRDLGTVLFRWAAVVMLLVACIVTLESPLAHSSALGEAMFTIERCLRVTQCGLVLFLMMFCKYLGTSPKQSSLGIAAGFGAFAGIQVVAVAFHSGSFISSITLTFITAITYDATVALWLFYILHKQPAREPVNSLLTSQRWEDSLSDIQHPEPSDALIPSFESLVDEVLSRSHDDGTRSSQPVAQKFPAQSTNAPVIQSNAYAHPKLNASMQN